MIENTTGPSICSKCGGWPAQWSIVHGMICHTCYTKEIPGPNSHATGTESRVCQDIAARQAKGLAKYGVTVENNPLNLKEWLIELYHEQLDACIYTKRAIEELDK
jgi:hypothetical protein